MNKITDDIKLLALVAFRLASNEDEIGIFAQGVLCALIRAFPNEAESISMGDLISAPDRKVSTTASLLFSMFVESKRNTEKMRVDDHPLEKMLREKAVSLTLKTITEGTDKK